MKRFILTALILVLVICSLSIVANADLTTKQTEALMNFTSQFISQGNQAGKLVYGGQDGYKSIQFRLVNITSLEVNGTRYTYMGNGAAGYATYEQYETGVIDGGDFVPGNYISLGCAEFVAAMYKGALGFNFDYAIAGHASAWTTKIYTSKEYTFTSPSTMANISNVLAADGKTSIPLFDVITNTSSSSVFFSATEMAKWKAGDILVGVYPDQNNGLGIGHVVMYAGNGEIYEASSTPRYYNGKYLGYNVHKCSCISSIFSPDYPIYQCLRIHDGVLDSDFEGYPMNIDFSKLSTSASFTDTKAPKFTDITVSTSGTSGYFSVKFTATDSYGTGRPVYLASRPNIMVRGTEQGESGVLGYYMAASSTTTPPEPQVSWYDRKEDTYITTRAAGKYSVWVHDEAFNNSGRYELTIEVNGDYVFKDPDGYTIAAKCAHITRSYHAAKAASHASTGNTVYYSCDTCGAFFATAKSTVILQPSAVIIPKIAHDDNGWITTATEHWHECSCGYIGDRGTHTGGTATCDALAVCSVCGASYGTKPAHSMTHTARVEATISSTGNVEYYYCSSCEKYYSDAAGTKEIAAANIVIPKLTFVVGDATGDGKINGLDIIRIKNYLAAYDYDTETSTVEIAPGANCTGDKKINGLDVIRLKNYLAAYDYDTGTSSVVLG